MVKFENRLWQFKPRQICLNQEKNKHDDEGEVGGGEWECLILSLIYFCFVLLSMDTGKRFI